MSICDNTEEGKRCFVHCGDRCNCQPNVYEEKKPNKLTDALDAVELLIQHNPPKHAWEEKAYQRILNALLDENK